MVIARRRRAKSGSRRLRSCSCFREPLSRDDVVPIPHGVIPTFGGTLAEALGTLAEASANRGKR